MKKTSKKSPIKKFAICFVAVLMCFSLAGGTFFLLNAVLPETEQSEPDPDADKKNWDLAGQQVSYLEGAGTENNPWQISSEKDWAFLGKTMKTLKSENVENSAMAVAQALSGEDIDMVVASAKARALGEITATAFSVADEKPENKYIKVKKSENEVSALSAVEKENPENFFEEHESVVRANWETYASADFQNNVELTSDINLSTYRWMPISYFSGNFNGNGHSIDLGERNFSETDLVDKSILTIEKEASAQSTESGEKDNLEATFSVGLMATTSGGTISNVCVEGSIYIDNNNYSDFSKYGDKVENIIENNEDGYLSSVTLYIGGYAAQAVDVSFMSCISYVTIESRLSLTPVIYFQYAYGGLIGLCRCETSNIKMEHCIYNTNGNPYGIYWAGVHETRYGSGIGGLIGVMLPCTFEPLPFVLRNYSVEISSCLVDTIFECYFNGGTPDSVPESNYVGGLIGSFWNLRYEDLDLDLKIAFCLVTCDVQIQHSFGALLYVDCGGLIGCIYASPLSPDPRNKVQIENCSIYPPNYNTHNPLVRFSFIIGYAPAGSYLTLSANGVYFTYENSYGYFSGGDPFHTAYYDITRKNTSIDGGVAKLIVDDQYLRGIPFDKKLDWTNEPISEKPFFRFTDKFVVPRTLLGQIQTQAEIDNQTIIFDGQEAATEGKFNDRIWYLVGGCGRYPSKDKPEEVLDYSFTINALHHAYRPSNYINKASVYPMYHIYLGSDGKYYTSSNVTAELMTNCLSVRNWCVYNDFYSEISDKYPPFGVAVIFPNFIPFVNDSGEYEVVTVQFNGIELFRKNVSSNVMILTTQAGSGAWAFERVVSSREGLDIASISCNINGDHNEEITSNSWHTFYDEDKISFTISPKKGYALVGIYNREADFTEKSNSYVFNNLSDDTILSNYDPGGGINFVKQLGDVSSKEIILPYEKIEEYDGSAFSRIYLCFIQLTYTVNVEYQNVEGDFIENNTLLLSCETNDSLWTGSEYEGKVKDSWSLYLDGLTSDCKNDNEKLYAKVGNYREDGTFEEYLYQDSNVLLSFLNFSPKRYDWLKENAKPLQIQSLENSSKTNYKNLLSWIPSADIDSFVIRLEKDPIDDSLMQPEVALQDKFNTWYALETYQSGNYGGSTEFSLSPIDDNNHQQINLEKTPTAGYAGGKVSVKSGVTGFVNLQDDAIVIDYDALFDWIFMEESIKSSVVSALTEGKGIFEALSNNSFFRNSCKIEIEIDYDLQKYQFRLRTSGDGDVVINTYENNRKKQLDSSHGTFEFYYDMPVELVETPDDGMQFVGWYLYEEGDDDFNDLNKITNRKALSNQKVFNFTWDKDMLSNLNMLDGTLDIIARFTFFLNEGTAPNYVNGVYEITSADHLSWLSWQVAHDGVASDGQLISKHIFRLMNDIQLYFSSVTPIGMENHPFMGIFDGNFKRISNFYIFDGSTVYCNPTSLLTNCGLFGYVEGATIKNLYIDGAAPSGFKNVGFVVGKAVNSNFERVAVLDNQTSYLLMEIYFYNVYGRPTSAYDLFQNQGDLILPYSSETHKVLWTSKPCDERENCGGIAGCAENSKFFACAVYASTSTYVEGTGLVGRSKSCELQECFMSTDPSSGSSFSLTIDDGGTIIKDCFFGDLAASDQDTLSEIIAKSNRGFSVVGVTENGETAIKDSKIWGVLNGNLVLRVFYWM